MQIELFHNIGAMVLNGFHTDTQPAGNFRFGQAFGQHAHDFLFSGCKPPIVGIVNPRFANRRFHQALDHFMRDGTVQKIFTATNGMQALNQPAGGGLLDHVTSGPGLEGFHDVIDF